MFNINQLIVTVEAGQGNNTIPMLLLESKLTGEVRNWSGRLSVLASTQLEMAYYNSKFALWEPVIEPIGESKLLISFYLFYPNSKFESLHQSTDIDDFKTVIKYIY